MVSPLRTKAIIDVPPREREREIETVLFLFSIHGYYREMLPVANYFSRRRAAVHVLFGYQGPSADEAKRICAESGFVIHEVPAHLGYVEERKPEGAQAAKKPVRRLLIPGTSPVFNTVNSLTSMPTHIGHSRQMLECGYTVLRRVVPDVVFGGPYQSCLRVDNAIGKLCHDSDVLFCCLPVSPYLGERNSIEARFHNVSNGMLTQNIDSHYSVVNRVLSYLFPGWIRTKNGKSIFMFDPVEMWASWRQGMLDANPWQKPSERYSIVFVESEFSKTMLLKSNYPAEKVIVSGKPILDEVFGRSSDSQYVNQLFGALNLKTFEPFVLVNVEPSVEHQYSSWEEHWRRFRSLMDCLKKTGLNIVLSLHPLCEARNYDFVKREYGFVISYGYRIMDLYPHCSLVVSFPCSTNLLSLVFNKKLLIYDFFGLTRDESSRHDLFRIPGASIAYDTDKLFVDVCEAAAGSAPRPAERALEVNLPACEVIFHAVENRLNVKDSTDSPSE